MIDETNPMTTSPQTSAIPPVPQAKCEPHARTAHGDTFVDPYEWMRDKNSPELQRFVREENEYYKARAAGFDGLKHKLFEELKSRVDETDMSLPTRMDGYWYFVRTQEGLQYGVQCRLPIAGPDDWDPPQISADDAPGSMPGEQVVFDPNIEAKGHDFFRLGGLDLTRDGRWLLYGVDTAGSERYDYRIRSLEDGHELPEVFKGISEACFTPDGKWVFYTVLDPSWRPYAVRRHQVGTPVDDDVEVFRDDDERFWVGVGMSFDERNVVIGSSSKTTSEVLMLPVDQPEGEFRAFIPRREGVEYDVSFARFEGGGVGGGDVPLALVYHNARNPNFEVDVLDLKLHEPPYQLGEGVVVAQGSPYGCEHGNLVETGASGKRVDTPYWSIANPTILQGSRGLGIEGIAMYRNFVVLSYRKDSLPHVAVMTKNEALEDFLAHRPWRFRELKPDIGGTDERRNGLDNETNSQEAEDSGNSSSYDNVKSMRDIHDGSTSDDEHLYSIGAGGNPSYDVPRMRYSFSSYTQPGQLRELDVATGASRLLKRAKVHGGFNAVDYRERRIWVRVRDGELVPVSLVWRPDRCESMTALDDDLSGLDMLDAADDPMPSPMPSDSVSAGNGVSNRNGDVRGDATEASAAIADARNPALGNVTETGVVGDVLAPALGNASQQGNGGLCAGGPMFITGYGAYESNNDPGFSVARVSMLDRGVLYAVVHVRGGGEMGRAWYEQGRRLNKRHTFEDFVDATKALQQVGLADPERTVANGGSAGGLLMGAVANIAPQCYAGIEADVPFVDALTSILDPSLPLTVTEWDEWGDPLHDKTVYEYMKSYSPYENAPFGHWQGDEQPQQPLQNQSAANQKTENRDAGDHVSDDHVSDNHASDNAAVWYPKIFATTSLNDTRVLYVEPLKWIARLQSQGVDAIARIEVEAGHGGTSGRYKQWQEVSDENAWCLNVMGIDR
ncbi:prolyl oligopeptidase family serine peptidase [Bifidobacterium sp. ESL0745]|uniref:S9 family peptidase n=1 Tax=Bifidobacterium sp. ESL0745 TaxID=2983226 RepID=UPI0023F9F0C1|nr:prolyl oligopeptidase family serine peptidase [Bifidobacterium sp. ESL0745]MDF7665566.1 prolyl oligopeptidase family serine peptidase [Bifidobacterium sp. ESL0745]